METTVDLAVEHASTWKQLIDNMGDLWQENVYRLSNEESIKETLIRQIGELLSFSRTEILSCEAFERDRDLFYESLKALIEFNTFGDSEWNDADSHLVDELDKLIYPEKDDSHLVDDPETVIYPEEDDSHLVDDPETVIYPEEDDSRLVDDPETVIYQR